MRRAVIAAAMVAGCRTAVPPPVVEPAVPWPAARCGSPPADRAGDAAVDEAADPASSLVAARGATIAAVVVDGAASTERAARAVLRVRPGDPLDPDAAARDVRRLVRLGVYRAVQVAWVAATATLRFTVREAPRIAAVGVEAPGASARYRRLFEGLRGAVDDPARDQRTLTVIRGALASDGYLDATGAVWTEPAGDDVTLCARVVPGPRTTVAALRFTGVHAFAPAALAALVGAPGGPNGVGGPFHRGRLVADLAWVQERYVDAGFLDVRFDEPVVRRSAGRLVVEVPVHEGTRRRVGAVIVGPLPDGVDGAALRAAVLRELPVGGVLGAAAGHRAEARLRAAAEAIDVRLRTAIELDAAAADGTTPVRLEVWR